MVNVDINQITQYVSIMLQYCFILKKKLTTVQDQIQVHPTIFYGGDIEHGHIRQDVSKYWNRDHHFVPGPKEPITIHLGPGFGERK